MERCASIVSFEDTECRDDSCPLSSPASTSSRSSPCSSTHSKYSSNSSDSEDSPSPPMSPLSSSPFSGFLERAGAYLTEPNRFIPMLNGRYPKYSLLSSAFAVESREGDMPVFTERYLQGTVPLGSKLTQSRKEFLTSVAAEMLPLLKAQTLHNRLRFDDLTRELLHSGMRPLACPCCLRLFSSSSVKQVQSHIVSSFYLREMQVALMLKYARFDMPAMMPTRAHAMSVELLCRDCDHAMGSWENDIKRGSIEFEALLDVARSGLSSTLYEKDCDAYFFRHGPLFRFILPNVFRLLVTMPEAGPLCPKNAKIVDCLRSYLREKCVHRATPRHAHHVDRKVLIPRLYAIPLDADALSCYALYHQANSSLLHLFPVCFPPFVVTNSTELWPTNYVIVYLDPFALVLSTDPITSLERWEILHSNTVCGPRGNSLLLSEVERSSLCNLLSIIHLQEAAMVEREQLYHPVVLSQIDASRGFNPSRRSE